MLGALMTKLRSAGWKVKRATFLVTKRRTRCILGLDLQGQVGIATIRNQLQKIYQGLTCSFASSRKVEKTKSLINSVIFCQTGNFEKSHFKLKIYVTVVPDSRKREKNPNPNTR